MKKNVLKTTAYFRCIVTLQNGFHRTLRLSIDKVAKFVAAIRQLVAIKNFDAPWLTERYENFFKEIELCPADFLAAKFINERDGSELLSLSV